MFQQLWTITRNTFIESIRQPIFVVVMLIATLALFLNPSLSAYTLEDDNKLLLDMGLSTLFLVGLLLGAFTATNVVSSEIENKTVLTVVSKPISRPTFIIGKYLGVTGAIGLAYWTLTIVFLLTVRHRVMQTASDPFDMPVWTFGFGFGVLAILVAALGNYFYNWVFTSAVVRLTGGLLTLGYALVLVVNKNWQFQSPMTDIDPQLMLGLMMVFAAITLLCAIAIATSTRLGQLMTLLICVGTFFLGLASQYMLGRHAEKYVAIDALYRIIPNLQFLWPADALAQGHDFTTSYIGMVLLYVLFMIGAILSLAVYLFQNREVG